MSNIIDTVIGFFSSAIGNQTAAKVSDIPNWFVVCMGVGTVFVGLICIVIICKVTSLFCRPKKSKAANTEPTVETKPVAEIENRQEIIAAVSAAAAEDMGTDISAIRILSFKKI